VFVVTKKYEVKEFVFGHLGLVGSILSNGEWLATHACNPILPFLSNGANAERINPVSGPGPEGQLSPSRHGNGWRSVAERKRKATT